MNKLKHLILILFSTSLIIACFGCSNSSSIHPDGEVSLIGESNHWSARLKVMKNIKTFSLSYKGKNNIDLGVISYSYKSSSYNITANEKLKDNKIISVVHSDAPLLKDEIVNVKVQWNGYTENFQLKAK